MAVMFVDGVADRLEKPTVVAGSEKIYAQYSWFAFIRSCCLPSEISIENRDCSDFDDVSNFNNTDKS